MKPVDQDRFAGEGAGGNCVQASPQPGITGDLGGATIFRFRDGSDRQLRLPLLKHKETTMADLGKIEYQVRSTTRYHVTRYNQSADGNTGGCETKGVYDNQEVAHEVAYALCKAECDRLGLAPGDERVKFPDMVPASGPVMNEFVG